MEEVKINFKSFGVVFLIIFGMACLIFLLNQYDGSVKNDQIEQMYDAVESSPNKELLEELIENFDTSYIDIANEIEVTLRLLMDEEEIGGHGELYIQQGKDYLKFSGRGYRCDESVNFSRERISKKDEDTVNKILTNKAHAVSILQELNQGENGIFIYNVLKTKKGNKCFIEIWKYRN